MSRQSSGGRTADGGRFYQRAHVIQHCAVCANPCCRLDRLVLELNWKQVKVFWQLDEARAAFDRRLALKGPEEIRAADGLYFAHRGLPGLRRNGAILPGP